MVPLVTEFLVCRAVLILQPAVGKKHLCEGLGCGYKMDADLLQPTGGAAIGFHGGSASSDNDDAFVGRLPTT